MSFWNTSSGESAVTDSKEFEVEGGSNFAPIPEGSNVLAMIEEAKWATVRDGIEEFVNIKWAVLKPEEFKNRKIFQKVWVADLDPNEKDKEKAIKKKDRALKMFSAIDANAGGRLSRLDDRPSDDQLAAALANKMMVIGLGVWKTKGSMGEDIDGNWVRAVSDKSKTVNVGAGGSMKSTPAAAKKDMGDEIPF